jgi:ATP-dependent Clp protease ATP-binding subunit ClpB
MKGFTDTREPRFWSKAIALSLVLAFAGTTPAFAGPAGLFDGLLKRMGLQRTSGERFKVERAKRKTRIESQYGDMSKDSRKFVDRFAEDLSKKAADGRLTGGVVGREGEMERLIEVLNKGGEGTSRNPMIIGRPGTGKTVLVRQLAYELAIHPENFPAGLRGKRIVQLDPVRFMANTGNTGDAENRIAALERFLSDNPDVIIFIDEMHTMSPKQKGQYPYLENMLPILVKHRFIGTSMPEAADDLFKKVEGLEHRRTVRINFREPSFLETMQILQPEFEKLKAQHGVRVPRATQLFAVEATMTHFKELAAPDSVKQVVWEIGSKIEARRRHGEPRVLRELRRKLSQQRNLLDHVEGTGPYYSKRRNTLRGEVQELEEQLAELESAWNEVADQVREVHEVNELLLKYQHYIEHNLEMVQGQGAVNVSELQDSIDNLAGVAKTYSSGRLSEVADLVSSLQGLDPTGPEALGRLSDVAELLAIDIAMRRDALNLDSRFALLDEMTKEDVVEVLSEKTGKNPASIRGGSGKAASGEDFANYLERTLKNKIVGQDHAINVVVSSIRRAQEGFKPKDKVVGSILLDGMSRVGKTYLGESLAKEMGENAYLRIPMADFKDATDIRRLQGSPPSYVGYEDDVPFFETVRNSPNAVILLDEAEKAHPDIFDFFLKLRDDAVLEDHRGERVDFSGVTFIWTTNALAEVPDHIIKALQDQPRRQRQVMERLLKSNYPTKFKPEVLNGFTDIVRMYQFSERSKVALVDRIWAKMSESIATTAEVDIRLAPSVVVHLAKISGGGDAAKINQILNSDIVDEIAALPGRQRGDRIEVDVKDPLPEIGLMESPFVIRVREDLRGMTDQEMARLDAEDRFNYDITEILATIPEEELLRMSDKEIEKAVREIELGVTSSAELSQILGRTQVNQSASGDEIGFKPSVEGEQGEASTIWTPDSARETQPRTVRQEGDI